MSYSEHSEMEEKPAEWDRIAQILVRTTPPVPKINMVDEIMEAIERKPARPLVFFPPFRWLIPVVSVGLAGLAFLLYISFSVPVYSTEALLIEQEKVSREIQWVVQREVPSPPDFLAYVMEEE